VRAQVDRDLITISWVDRLLRLIKNQGRHRSNQGKGYENNDEYGYNQDVLSFPPSDDKYAEFMRTEPPMFSSTTYPLEVADWIKTIEEKLDMIQCNDGEKALYASWQLIGAA
jgi:hypothetical protein